MLAQFRGYIFGGFCFMLFAGAAWAQIAAIEGDVKGPDGQPVKGAVILIERQDMKGTYKGAKTDKKRPLHLQRPSLPRHLHGERLR